MKIKNVTVISLEGDIAHITGQQLDYYLKAQIHQGNKRLVLDFTNVDFISSNGLRMLLSSIKYTRTNGGDIFLANVSPMVLNILKTTGIASLLQIYSDVNAAIVNF